MKNLLDKELLLLIEAGESLLCEYKGDLSSKDDKEKICRTICAFANDIHAKNSIGIIALGVSDDGTPSGIPITDDLELKIQNIRAEGKIIPLPSFITQKIIYCGHEILCISIYPAISPPIKYDGRIWIRSGNSTELAKSEDERRLNEKRKVKEQPDDMQVLSYCRMNDLNINYFKLQYLVQAVAIDILEENGRSLEQQLASTRMIGYVEDSAYPTVLGMLCLGLSPTDAIPGAYVQFLKIEGNDLTGDILDELTIEGNIEDIIKRMEEKFHAHNKVYVNFTFQTKEERRFDYPKIAFEQLFRNAVMHRSYLGTNAPIRVYWYSNRIEITNPGGPYGMVTSENFGEGATDYRNPNLAAALKDLGYVQKFGAGISRSKKELVNNGNPELEIEVQPNFITIIMKQRKI
jgi:ATP-dependent DNA helicase RecG